MKKFAVIVWNMVGRIQAKRAASCLAKRDMRRAAEFFLIMPFLTSLLKRD